MELSNNIKTNVAHAVNLNRAIKIAADDVTMKMFLDVAKAYVEKYGELPIEWESEINKIIAYDRYTKELITRGFDQEDLSHCSLKELQSMMELDEYMEVTIARANGGVSVLRTPLKKAA